MTVILRAPTTLPGCICQHAAWLHRPAASHGGAPDHPGCIVGWQGAGEPAPGAPHLRYWPAGCSCSAVGTWDAPNPAVAATETGTS